MQTLFLRILSFLKGKYKKLNVFSQDSLKILKNIYDKKL